MPPEAPTVRVWDSLLKMPVNEIRTVQIAAPITQKGKLSP